MNASSTDKVTLFGVTIDNLTMTETVERIEQMIRQGGVHQHVVINVDKVVKMESNPELRKTIQECDLITTDGQPIVWVSKLVGAPLKQRVTGIDLFGALMAHCAERGLHPYLLGARPEVVAKTVQVLQGKYPKLQLAGWRNGYWSPPEEGQVVQEIKKARPDVLCTAMGSPRQEMFLQKWKQELQVPFVMGVGGSFDVTAGVLKRAPQWMQNCGLEWLYRLGQEPRRLWRRYLKEDMAFFRLAWREWRVRRR